MQNYFNQVKCVEINLIKDSCDFETWKKKSDNIYSCCKHPDGFYIFLKSNELMASDEYKEGDPYTVIDNINSSFHQNRVNCTIDLIKDGISGQNQKLLDMGCGEGHFTEKIKQAFPSYEVHGLDYSLSAIVYANSNFKNIDFVVANAYSPPFKDEYFDIVVCNNIWEHVPDPLNLLISISRVLKTDGLLIISTPSRYRLRNLIRACLGKKIKFMSGLHVTEYTVGQVVEQLNHGGYKVKKIYSRSVEINSLPAKITKAFFKIIIKLVNSHHILELTAFYSAIKLPAKN